MINKDLMFNKEYANLYLKDGEEVFEFKYKEGNKIFRTLSIKRPIKKVGNEIINEKYFDLESPYGYGGYLLNSKDEKFIKKAFNEYRIYCKEQNIIAEFVRFHPFAVFIKNELDFYMHDRDIVVKEINNGKSVLDSYSSKVRNIIRKCDKMIQIRESENIDKFIEIYYYTMKKNNADDFYYFNKNYFEKLLKLNDVVLYEAVFENNIIAMSFFIFSHFGYYHLSANTPNSYKLNANYLLLHYAFIEAQRRNIKYFILGGGTTSDPNDSLFEFKKKFSKLLKPFYIGGIIFDKNKYQEYNNLWLQQSKKDIKFFLKYRLEIK